MTIEGGDGTGKSRHIRLLDEYLAMRQVPRLLTREPGDTALGRELRRLLVERGRRAVSREAELFMILADRAQHVQEVVRPALEQGKLVISDRFADSTLAYQGFGRGMDLDLLRRLNHEATGGTMPDLTIILDCPVEAALKRAAERATQASAVTLESITEAMALERPAERAGSTARSHGFDGTEAVAAPERAGARVEALAAREDRFEAEGAAFQRRVRDGFIKLAKADPERCRIVDSEGPVEATQEQVRRIVEERLGGFATAGA